MPETVWLVMGGALMAFVLWRLLVPNLDKVVDRAAKDNDPGPILEALGKRIERARPAAYNHAIRRLWDSYQRPLAIELIRDLAKNFGNSPIAQYWIKQVISVEPNLARKGFSRDFLNTYYQPELAAKCGHVG